MRIWCLKLEPNGRFARASSNDGLICPTLQSWHDCDPAAHDQHVELVRERQEKLQQRFMEATGLDRRDAVAVTVAGIMRRT